MESDSPVLIIGASVRSAAQSALRSGYKPICADLFADEDLSSIAQVRKIEDYPGDFVGWANTQAQRFGKLPLVYTGGLENYPDVVDELRKTHTLHGNDGETLRRVRDVFELQNALQQADLPHSESQRLTEATDRRLELDAGDWLIKPNQGSAGIGIRRFIPGDGLQAMEFAQRCINGPSIAAVFSSDGQRCRLIGVTLQLVGFQSLAAGQFGWCGSFGPICMPEEKRKQVLQIGDCLTDRFGLRGVFGVDCILAERGIVPIEVNPRFTGSVEIHELAGQFDFGRDMIRAADPSATRSAERERQAAPESASVVAAARPSKTFPGFVGKAIIFADRSVGIRGLSKFDFIADIPADGSEIERHHPVCTVFGSGNTPDQCLSNWAVHVCQIQAHLFGESSLFEAEIRELWRQCSVGIEH